MNMNKLKKWLEDNHPEVLTEALRLMVARPSWDLADATDLIDSHVYNEYCELEH